MKRIAVYAGTFDPLTLGHEDIALRGAMLFDELVIGIGINPDKQPLFSPDERKELISEIFLERSEISVQCFSGLTVDFARSVGATIMVRGVRTVSDIETEFTMALANHAIAPELETVFLMAGESYSHISSTLIKQIAIMGQDKSANQLRKFVPELVLGPLLEKVRQSPPVQ